ncbi:PcfK-like family protein [Desemzia sp. C1]|uniref:Cas9 inhibitor AcrIIA9 family protein n=1 Tax=Desemzia sp. C1 TaxID=2892016 RepID=UPI001E39C13A|nr:Cas9 inhibitor AcrIIA9 family protein [Desemzia sp. C1]MCI3027715.1 PcfK-like family protein [Desemzia sp. C1]
MTEVKQKALEKMLDEMNGEHTGAEDTVHNWLCDQNDEKLFEGILKKGRSIKGAMKYCISEASKQKSGNAAMVDDKRVFSWVREYFTAEKEPEIVADVAAEVTTSASKPVRKVKKKAKAKNTISEGEQLSLLDML